MKHQRLTRSVASLAASLPLVASAPAQTQARSAAADTRAADLEDQCFALMDRFDEIVRLAPKSDELDAAKRLRRTGASECFRQGDPIYMPYGVQDLRSALRRVEALVAPTLACEGDE